MNLNLQVNTWTKICKNLLIVHKKWTFNCNRNHSYWVRPRKCALSTAHPLLIEHEHFIQAPNSGNATNQHCLMLSSSGDRTDPSATFLTPDPRPSRLILIYVYKHRRSVTQNFWRPQYITVCHLKIYKKGTNSIKIFLFSIIILKFNT